ncbi:MAG: hypothetical protein GPJ54_11125 [Candidatus Heimdallarchaeota archaeon]|nr:hypothetical protein [Candidatus Heimdallarchaeota archaeon]
MYTAKIAGSRYITTLEQEMGKWLLRIKLDDVVEAELALPYLTKRSIHKGLGEIFNKVNVVVNSFQYELIHKELLEQVDHLLSTNETEGGSTATNVQNTRDPIVENLESKIASLEKTLDLVNDRLERLEELIQNQ